MTEAEQLQLESDRAQRARVITEDPLFADALSQIKAEIVDKWAQCPARDTEGREWLWNHYQVALKFEAILKGHIETGRLADVTRQENKLRETVRKVAKYF